MENTGDGSYRGLPFRVYKDVSGRQPVWFAEATLYYEIPSGGSELPDRKSKRLVTPQFLDSDSAIELIKRKIDEFIKQYFN